MDTETLRLFVAACELGNLSQLARRENMSPPAITRRFQQLEKELKTPLLKRNHRGITPTAEGRLLIEKSSNLLLSFNEIINSIHDQSNISRSGTIVIYGSFSLTAGKLIDDINDFLSFKINEKINIQLKEGDKQTITNELRAGTAELGVFWNATDTSNLQLFPYRKDNAAVVVHNTHALAQKDKISYAEATQFESVRTKTTRNVELMLNRTGSVSEITKKNRVEVPTFEALLRFIKTGRYIGLCPTEVAEEYAEFYNLRIIPLTDKWATRNHVIACRDILTLSPASRALLEYLQAQRTF